MEHSLNWMVTVYCLPIRLISSEVVTLDQEFHRLTAGLLLTGLLQQVCCRERRSDERVRPNTITEQMGDTLTTDMSRGHIVSEMEEGRIAETDAGSYQSTVHSFRIIS